MAVTPASMGAVAVSILKGQSSVDEINNRPIKEEISMARLERVIVYTLLLVALFLGLRNGQEPLTAAESVLDEIRAKRIVVVDDEGRERICLEVHSDGGSGENGAAIVLCDEEEKVRMLMLLANEVVGLSLYDKDKDANKDWPQVGISVPNEEGGYILLTNRHGDRLVAMGSELLGHGGVRVWDKYGEMSKFYGHW